MKLLGHSKAIQNIQPESKKYENSSQVQRSRSHITNFEPLLVFIMGPIPTKLHQFVISSFLDFHPVWVPGLTIDPLRLLAGCRKRRLNQALLNLRSLI